MIIYPFWEMQIKKKLSLRHEDLFCDKVKTVVKVGHI